VTCTLQLTLMMTYTAQLTLMVTCTAQLTPRMTYTAQLTPMMICTRRLTLIVTYLQLMISRIPTLTTRTFSPATITAKALLYSLG
jgi:hypothetical protein